MQAYRRHIVPALVAGMTFLSVSATVVVDNKCPDLKAHPGSIYSPAARVAAADSLFFMGDYPAAAALYGKVDDARLSPLFRDDYNYRYALSMIRIGLYDEARGRLRKLQGKKEYRDAYTFYNAWLDYVNNDYNRAYEGFKRVPEGIDGLEPGYYMAQIEYSRGDFAAAARRARAILSKRSRSSESNPYLKGEMQRIAGLALFKQGDTEAALPYLRQYVASTDVPVADVLYALGVDDYENGRFDDAARRFEQVVESSTDELTQSAWVYLGQCRLHTGDERGAAIAFERASTLPADRDVTRLAGYNYATSLTRGGNVPFGKSAAMLERFAQLYPDSRHASDVEEYLAGAYYAEHNYQKALDAIDAVTDRTPRVLAARQRILYALGVERLGVGDYPAAITALRGATDAIRNNKESSAVAAEANLRLGDALYARGDYKQAVSPYRAAADSKSLTGDNRAAALYGLAYALYKSKDYRGAEREFGKVITLLGKNSADSRYLADAKLRRADCLYYTGRYSEALPLYSESVDAAGAGDYALYRRAVILGLTSNPSKKIDDLLLLERKYPNSSFLPKALLELAQTYEAQGRPDAASDAYRRRLAVNGSADIDELVRMSETMYRGKRWADLVDIDSRIRSLGGLTAEEVAEQDLRLAEALSHLGRTEQARQLYTSLAGNTESLAGAQAAVTLAQMDYDQRDYAAAEQRMLAFTDAGTPHQYWLARGFILLADAYTALGNKTLAQEYLESLRENYPGSETDIFEMIDKRLNRKK